MIGLVALDLLAEQQFLDGLPALLPEGAWHANKTGELSGVRHDMSLASGARREQGRQVGIQVALTDDGEVEVGAERTAPA